MNPTTWLLALCAALALHAGPARAHDDRTLDAMAAPHGGQLREAGAYHFELVVAPQGTAGEQVTVHVTDHAGKPVPTLGGKGSVLVQSGKERVRLDLVPDGAHAFRGQGLYIAGADLKAVVYITLPGQSGVQARFAPFAKAKAGAKKHDSHAGHKH